MIAIIIAQSCINIYGINRLTNYSGHDYWGSDGYLISSSFFNERTPQSLYIVGDTVHILWVRQGGGNRYNRSRDRGATWDWCTGSDCHGVQVLNYSWESSIVARYSKVHAISYCWDCSPSSWVPYNRSLNNGTSWDYPSSGQNIFAASEYGLGARSLDSPAMDATQSGDTVLLVVDAYSQGVRVKRTFDGGTTWGPYGGIVVATPSYTDEKHPQIAYNNAGKFYVCYTDFPYVMVTYSVDYGSTWSAPYPLDTLSVNLVYNSCHISADGNFVSVVWFDMKGNAINVYYRESVDGGLTWRPKVNITGLTSVGDTAAGATVVNHGYITYITWFERSSRTGGDFEIMEVCKPHPDSSWYPVQRITYIGGRSLWPMVAYNWSGRWGIICWQDNAPGNYEVYCSSFIPLLGDTTLGYKENPLKENPFTVKGNLLILNGEYEVFDVNGRLRAKGEGGSLMLRKGIYFIRIKGKTYKVKL